MRVDCLNETEKVILPGLFALPVGHIDFVMATRIPQAASAALFLTSQ
jgi:hypothetical protein